MMRMSTALQLDAQLVISATLQSIDRILLQCTLALVMISLQQMMIAIILIRGPFINEERFENKPARVQQIATQS
jgi:hypothetical protein